MEQQRVTAETLHLIGNGEAGVVINQAIEVAANDLDDRDDDRERQVAILVRLKKNEAGFLILAVEATPKLPVKRTTASIALLQRHQSGMGVHLCPFEDNPAQRALGFDEDRK